MSTRPETDGSAGRSSRAGGDRGVSPLPSRPVSLRADEENAADRRAFSSAFAEHPGLRRLLADADESHMARELVAEIAGRIVDAGERGGTGAEDVDGGSNRGAPLTALAGGSESSAPAPLHPIKALARFIWRSSESDLLV